jgi:DNA-binding FadR family transcriptional regulator
MLNTDRPKPQSREANSLHGELSRIEKAYGEMAATADADRWNAADVRFHLTILDASGNARASLMQHQAILRAIRHCKPIAARLAVRNILAQTDRTIERSRVRGSSQQKA